MLNRMALRVLVESTGFELRRWSALSGGAIPGEKGLRWLARPVWSRGNCALEGLFCTPYGTTLELLASPVAEVTDHPSSVLHREDLQTPVHVGRDFSNVLPLWAETTARC